MTNAYEFLTRLKGCALIINNLRDEQSGTREDETKLKDMFETLKIDCEIIANQSKDDVQTICENLKVKDFKSDNYNMYFLVVISHGTDDHYIKFDNPENPGNPFSNLVYDAYNFVKNLGENEHLKLCPKVLLFEFCRGKDHNYGEYGQVKNQHENQPPKVRIPKGSDVFIGFATTTGYTSVTQKTGSPFIQALCSSVKKLYKQQTFNYIFQEAQGIVAAKMTNIMEGSDKIESAMQIPESRSTLRKHLFLTDDVLKSFLQGKDLKESAENGARFDPMQENNQALINATNENNVDEVTQLLDRGADPNCYDEKMLTPLHVAASNGYEKLCNVLLKPRAQIDLTDLCERTPLHLAAQKGHIEVCKILLQKGANPNAIDSEKQTPLHLAAQKGHIEVCKILLQRDAIPNAIDSQKQTPLHLAAKLYGNENVCRLLFQNGANLNKIDKNKQTPLHLAVIFRNENVFEWLLQNGANVDAIDSNKKTPLHLAAYILNENICNLLVVRGADKSLRDIDGQTPLDVIRNSEFVFDENQRHRIIQLLE